MDFFKKKWVRQFPRFVVVGTSATIIQLGLLYLLTEFFELYYILSASVALVISITFAFIFNKWWTFNVKGLEKIKFQYLSFFSIYLVGIFVNMACLYFLVEFFDIYYLLAQWIIIIILGFANFVLQKIITFKA